MNSKKTNASYEELVNKAKKMINDGFERMGRSIRNPSMLDRYLLAATYKAVRFSDAVLLLCKSGLTNEAIPILRSLIEHSFNMRWITNKDTNERLRMYLEDFGKEDFGSGWTDKTLLDRMEEIGFEGRDYFDFCVKFTYSYAHVNASSLDWKEVINHPQLSGKRWSPNALYAVVAQMLGHVMRALNSHFKGYFSDYDNIWKQIKVDKDIRRKVEAIRNLFKNNP